MQKSVGEVPRWRWWTRRRPVFFTTLAAVTSAIVFAGWYTGLRDVFHGAAVSIAIVALLPFLVIGLGIATLMAFVAFAMLFGGEAAVILEGAPEGGVNLIGAGGRMIGPYYRFLDRLRRHPIIWGACCGVVLGCATLGAVLALKVLPAEMDTVDTLADAQARIDAHYEQRGSYPRPGPDGALHLPGDSEPLRDAFGNLLEYRVSGHWKLASYRLRSRGYDGDAGTSDDLCVHGATRLAGAVSGAMSLLDRVRKDTSRSLRLEGTRALRCD